MAPQPERQGERELEHGGRSAAASLKVNLAVSSDRAVSGPRFSSPPGPAANRRLRRRSFQIGFSWAQDDDFVSAFFLFCFSFAFR